MFALKRYPASLRDRERFDTMLNLEKRDLGVLPLVVDIYPPTPYSSDDSDSPQAPTRRKSATPSYFNTNRLTLSKLSVGDVPLPDDSTSSNPTTVVSTSSIGCHT